MTGAGFSCGACKFLRRKCTTECVFAPYFCYSQGADHFAAVHKVFGASNVSKLLMKIPLQNRSEATITISYEALARLQNPVYGCVAQIFALEQQVVSLQKEIDYLTNTMMHYVSLGLPNHASLQDIDILNNELPFSFQFNDTNNCDHLNQQTLPLFSAPQASCLLVNLEDESGHYHSFMNNPVMENDCNILNT